MPDITKCTGTGCTMKEHCYRYTAPDSYCQAYDNFAYIGNGHGCRMILADPEEWKKNAVWIQRLKNENS